MIECAYDSQGRRFEKKVPVAGTTTLSKQMLSYALKRIICWDPTEPVATRPLVFRYAPNSLNLFYAFDGNKNVSDVFYRMNSNGIGAHYDYAPFGATTRTHRDSSASFDIVTLNPFRFSSEYYDPELDLVYYNYRHYSASLGRFLSRDPIREKGGLNLYPFVKNAPIFKLDELGRSMIAPGAEVWNPLRPPGQVYYPSYPESICDGYKPSANSKCCRGGKLVDDPYPRAAFTVCKQFVRIYNGSFLAENMACVANCLIKLENSIADEPDCANKNNARMNAHLSCYWSCKFVPILKLPEGGTNVGIEMLYPDWEYSGTPIGIIMLVALKIYPEEDFISKDGKFF